MSDGGLRRRWRGTRGFLPWTCRNKRADVVHAAWCTVETVCELTGGLWCGCRKSGGITRLGGACWKIGHGLHDGPIVGRIEGASTVGDWWVQLGVTLRCDHGWAAVVRGARGRGGVRLWAAA